MVGPDGALPLPWIAPWLRQALATQRGHAVLLYGPPGIGQWELALALAQGWLCEAGEGGRPCGRCASCRLVQAHSHPDLLVLLPEALQAPLGWASGNDDAAEATESASEGKKRQPSKEIKVDAVRGAVAFAQTTPARGRGKVVVLNPAERMNAVSANALLKTLEEPAGAARFVLACATPELLLPTIRSRCQAMALPLPDPSAATAWLAGQGVQGAEVLLAAAGGQPLTALEASRGGLEAAAWARLPASVARGEAGPLAGWPVPRVIDALHKLCHDLLLLGHGGAPRYFPAESLPRGAALPALLAWSAELRRAARHAEHPLNAGLAIEALVTQGASALRTARAARPAAAAGR